MNKSLSSHLRGAIAAALGVWVFANSSTARADCHAAASAHVKSLAANASVTKARLFTKGNPEGVSIVGDAECIEGKKCLEVYLYAGDAGAAPTPDPKSRDVAPKWKRVPDSRLDCPNLFEYHLESTPKSTSQQGAVVEEDERRIIESQSDLLKARTPEDALRALNKARTAYVGLSAQGTAHGAFEDVAAEGLQILGQIVVDRASNKGYTLMQDRLKRAFGCSASKDFIKTCALLDALRIQDIAMAPEALAKAMTEDLVRVVNAAGTVNSEARLPAAVFKLTISLLTKPAASRGVALHDVIRELILYATTTAPTGNEFQKLTAAQQAAVLGSLTFARCIAQNNKEGGNQGTSIGLLECNVEAELDALNPGEKPRSGALTLAHQMVAIGAAEKPSTATVQLAIDTLGVTACMVAKNEPEPKLECSEIHSATVLDEPTKVAFTVAFADALLERDAASFIVAAAKVVDLKWTEKKEHTNKRSALRLVTGLLNYAATYADDEGEANDAGKHAERTKILESLTHDMTDRNGRGGDCIWSLGGALRLEGGVRVATRGEGTTFHGPIGLPLGIAFDTVPDSHDGWGFHLQLDAANLGNYLALDNEPKVKKPELGDAFAPGLTIGAAYGQDLPVVLAAFFSYTPQFRVSANPTDKQGSINFGATVGIHVPLLDMN